MFPDFKKLILIQNTKLTYLEREWFVPPVFVCLFIFLYLERIQATWAEILILKKAISKGKNSDLVIN